MAEWGEVIGTRERGKKVGRESGGCEMGKREGVVGESENGEGVECGKYGGFEGEESGSVGRTTEDGVEEEIEVEVAGGCEDV